MATAEINSFVGKFLNLWKSGFDTSLKFETRAGKASISISLGLGAFSETDNVAEKPCSVKRVSPSRIRRRLRRAKARQNIACREESHTAVKDESSEEDVVPSQLKGRFQQEDD